jgi:hypothetical protein
LLLFFEKEHSSFSEEKEVKGLLFRALAPPSLWVLLEDPITIAI